MEVITYGRVPEAAEIFQEQMPVETWQEMTRLSCQFFLAREENPVAFGGVIKPSLLSDEAALWMVVNPTERRITRRSFVAAQEYLRSLPWKLRAECELLSRRDAKFLRFLGFRHVTSLADRHVYFWRP